MKTTWKEVPSTNGRYAVSIYGELHDIQNNRIINQHMLDLSSINYTQITMLRAVGDCFLN